MGAEEKAMREQCAPGSRAGQTAIRALLCTWASPDESPMGLTLVHSYWESKHAISLTHLLSSGAKYFSLFCAYYSNLDKKKMSLLS